MCDNTRQDHWDEIYKQRPERETSWFEESPALSLDLIHATGAGHRAAIVDIGGGASRLADALLNEGFSDITVIDLSAEALAKAQARLGERQTKVQWIVADVTQRQPARRYDVWHDRATFHFLTEPGDRAAYLGTMRRAVRLGGHVIIGTFAPDGPERCSGLPVMRYDAAALGNSLGADFEILDSRRHAHVTPAGVAQSFQFVRAQRIAQE